MSRLCMYLPPLSSDYAGACSALFDLNALVVLHDGACCSRNYTAFDEPRWFGSKRPTFCSALREIDAVLGDDDKLVRKVLNTLDGIERPELIAILGTPVPSMIGTDLRRIARELQMATGIPGIGVGTTGTRHYDRGIEEVSLLLLDMFAEKPERTVPLGVNVLGLNAIDFGANGDAEKLVDMLESAGLQVVCPFPMGASVASIRCCAEASVNLVVSKAGLAMAREMRRRWAIPYVVGLPIDDGGLLVDRLVAAARWEAPTRCSRRAGQVGRAGRADCADCAAGPATELAVGPAVIVGDQVIACAMRDALIRRGVEDCAVASLFGIDAELAQPQDFAISDEEAFIDRVVEGGFAGLVGDPLLLGVPGAEKLVCAEVPHGAVSSRLHWDDAPSLFGDDMKAQLDGFAAELASRASAAGRRNAPVWEQG